MKTRVLAAVMAAGVAMATAATAETWLKAESTNFVVYSNTSQSVTKLFVTKLESFDYTLGELYRATHAAEREEAPPFKIFLLKDPSDMRAVWPCIGGNVGGFYRYCSEGAVAYAPVGVLALFGSES